MKKTLLFVLLAALVPTLVRAAAGQTFTAKANGIDMKFFITYEGDSYGNQVSTASPAIDMDYFGDIEIPSSVTYNGKEYTVTEIGSLSFSTRHFISVKIPSTVKRIGPGAFQYCSHFFAMEAIQPVVIPASVTEIAESAFQGIGTTAINVEAGNANYVSIDGVLYDSKQEKLLAYPVLKAGDTYTIPSSVKCIGGGCFAGSRLTEINIPNSVTEYGFEAFYNCQSLKSITISANVTKIGYGAFAGGTKFKIEVAADNPQYTLIDGCIYTKDMSEIVCYPPSKTDETYTIRNGTKSIFEHAFRDSNCPSVTIPNTVVTIGSCAFLGCKLTSVDIAASVTSIGFQAFDFCYDLAKVYSRSTTPPNISYGVFSNISKNAVLYVPSGCKASYEAAGWKNYFSEIVEMSDGIVANNVTYEMTDDNKIEVKTAEVNRTTGSVSIAQTVVVNNVAVPVTAIAPKAFQNVEAVKSVTIPATVESIGDLAFAGCTNLEEVLCLNPTPVNLSVASSRGLLKDGNTGSTVSQFDGVDLSRCTLYVLTEAEDKYKASAGWNSFGEIKPFAGMGDVNTDKAIDVSDVVGEVNQILGKASDGFLYGAGDMNADNNIDVSDVVSIVNVILGKTAGARSMERRSAVAETTAADHLSLMAGNEGGLSLVLDNTADYIAAQFDVRLSEGQTLEQVTKGQRARGHQLATAKMGEGVYRVLLYTIGDRTFSGQSGEVVSLGVAGEGDVTVENITFITVGESRKKFDDLSNQLTGIGAVLNDKGEMINDKDVWYDLQGRRLETVPTSKGIYLKNGKKVVVK